MEDTQAACSGVGGVGGNLVTGCGKRAESGKETGFSGSSYRVLGV